ncbi:splicing factor 3A subunit 2-like [Penaeus chinensis]|uniref:splicing factor 3A subunit 2-like n=1 Tax=Penaeus chinensis TaxID=139456 RepID=UPI001FB7CB12|nr:splicing factor 3A subunit 2-like [Penaeus chinensis]
MWLTSRKLVLLVVCTLTGHAVGAADDQDAEGSWASYGWADSWYHDTPEPAPLDRPRQRHLGVGEQEVDAAPLYVVWEELPLLAKEGVTSEEARWVPERAPLRVIKESYTSGSREFDHNFLKSPRGSLGFVGTPVYVPEPHHVPEIQPHVHEPPPHVHEAPHVPEVQSHVPEPPPHVHEAPHVPEHVLDIQPHAPEAPHEPEPPVYVPASPPVTKAYPGPPPPQYSVRPGQARKYYLTEEGQQEHRRVPGLRQST